MAEFIGQCKHQMKDTKASTWNNDVFRQCKLQAKNDGYCDIHHPENVAKSLARANLDQIIYDMREIERREESVVGAFMRLRDADKFSSILADVRSMEEVSRKLRINR